MGGRWVLRGRAIHSASRLREISHRCPSSQGGVAALLCHRSPRLRPPFRTVTRELEFFFVCEAGKHRRLYSIPSIENPRTQIVFVASAPKFPHSAPART